MVHPPPNDDSHSQDSQETQPTSEILIRAKEGDQSAQDALVRRHLKTLIRLAHGRLPSKSKAVFDTEDLVQATFLRAFKNLSRIKAKQRGQFLAYLRKILENLIRDAMRSAYRQPSSEPTTDELATEEPSPLDVTAIHEKLEAYERVIHTLTKEQQEVVRLRIEIGMSYQDIADAVGAPSANAVRMQVGRALAHMAGQMAELRGD